MAVNMETVVITVNCEIVVAVNSETGSHSDF